MDESVIRKILPHNEEAEQAVIGSMLMSRSAVQAASEMLTGSDFYKSQYGVIFDAMTELFHEGSEVDPVTVQNRLREKKVPPEISDMDYVLDLLQAVPTSVNIRQYAAIVSEKSVLRQMIRLTDEISNSCYQDDRPVADILDLSEKKLFALLQNRGTPENQPIRQVVMEALKTIEKAARTKGNVTGLATGFTDLDYKTSGFQNSDLILIAARPSMGKTAFALNITEYVAFRKQKTAVFFSLEMTRYQLVNRLFAMNARINAQNMRNGNMKDSEWTRLIDSAGMIGNSHLIIDDTPGITVREMRQKCLKYKLEHGLDLVLIDYLQLMSSGSKRVESRQQEITEISRSLKALARELQVPVVALSQLSRAVETRSGDHRPMLSDLRESGAIEQDADVVMFLYRDDYYHKDSEESGICEVILAKQRNGPIGTVKLAWLPEYTKFMNAEREKRQNMNA
ncbi:MAG: replicative DNA helicase [Eubacterium sp.]|nr:replicative DNA helicase [Eubacterium sp.]